MAKRLPLNTAYKEDGSEYVLATCDCCGQNHLVARVVRVDPNFLDVWKKLEFTWLYWATPTLLAFSALPFLRAAFSSDKILNAAVPRMMSIFLMGTVCAFIFLLLMIGVQYLLRKQRLNKIGLRGVSPFSVVSENCTFIDKTKIVLMAAR